jgi:hypothetical protein
MYQWSVVVALLMKESDGLIATALPSALCAILLRLFAASAKELHALISSDVPAEGNQAGRRDRKIVEAHLATAWESLAEQLQKDFPRLLNRFKDNEDNNLEVLSKLLPFFDCTSGVATAKGFKQCLQCVIDVFAISSNEMVLQQLSIALKSWTSSNRSNPGNTKLLTVSLSGLLEAQHSRLVSGLDTCKSLMTHFRDNIVAQARSASRGGHKAGLDKVSLQRAC